MDVLIPFQRFSDENKEGSKPSLVGYTTLYPFLYFPDRTRLRLSQFLILPPYLRLGLGSQMYRHVYSMVLEDPMIVELTGITIS